MKRCPYCDEEVRGSAIKCKHCGSMLDSRSKDALEGGVTIGSGQTLLQYNTLDSATTADGKAIIHTNQSNIIKTIDQGGRGIVCLNRPNTFPSLFPINIRVVENLLEKAITVINPAPNCRAAYRTYTSIDRDTNIGCGLFWRLKSK